VLKKKTLYNRCSGKAPGYLKFYLGRSEILHKSANMEEIQFVSKEEGFA
jgi:hypothetical protein